MDAYKLSLSQRKVFWMIINVLVILLIVILSLVNPQGEEFSNMAAFRLGLCVALELLLVKKWYEIVTGLKNDDQLRALYIKEQDERHQQLMQQTGAIGFEISIIGLMVAVIVASFFNQVVMITLVAVIVFLSLVKGILKLYYHVKF